MQETKRFGTAIIGGGPAGTAVLLAACRNGNIEALLDSGVVLIESGPEIGAGWIGNYGINSDSTGDTFIDCLRHGAPPKLAALIDHELGQALKAAGDKAVPLGLVGEFSLLVGEVLQQMLAEHPACAVLTSTNATQARRKVDGNWRIKLQTADSAFEVEASRLVLATGGHQPVARLKSEFVAGINLSERYGHKLLQSGEVLQLGAPARLAARLNGRAAKVAIIGGSTSAVAVAHNILNRMPRKFFGTGAVTLLHRRELRIYYLSEAAALADGYTDFGPEDICPLTQRVFRLAGLRLDSRKLIMQAFGLGNLPPEPRLSLHKLQENDAEAVRIMDEADLVVAALGYRPYALPLAQDTGMPIHLFAARAAQAPLVDGACRVLDEHRQPVPGVYGIGLAAGFVPRGVLGGEPSFSGQANGLWLWQTAVGGLIVDALLAPPASAMTPYFANDDQPDAAIPEAAVELEVR